MSSTTTLDRIFQSYGDLLFDLCESILWSPINVQLAFRAIIKDIRKDHRRRSHVAFDAARHQLALQSRRSGDPVRLSRLDEPSGEARMER